MYPSDLTDSQWERIKHHFEVPKTGSGRAAYRNDPRDIVDAILYMETTQCQWRMLPDEFPPWQTVYNYFKKWRDSGTWDSFLKELGLEIKAE
jgi:putative transposase